MTYLYERHDWPRFTWRVDALAELLSAVRYQQGLLLGRTRALGYPLQKEATLAALTEETVKSSAIEGEVLNPESVRSSLARRMVSASPGLLRSTAISRESSK
jgi:Fic family protein